MASPTPRRALALGVLAVWVVVVGMHIKREYFRAEDEVLVAGARSLGPVAHFYAVRMDDRTIGLAGSRLDTIDSGYTFEDWITLDVPAMDTVHRAVTRTTVELDTSLRLRGFSFDLRSEVGDFEVEGRAEGDSELVLELGTDGDRQRTALPLDEGTMLAATLPLRLAASGRLRVGESYRARVFDPSVVARRDVELRVVEADTFMVPDSAVLDTSSGEWTAATWDTVAVWRIEQAFGDMSVDSWIDADGRVVRAESPVGFSVERTAYELIQQDWERDRSDPALASGYGAIIESTAIASDVSIEDVEASDRLAVRLGGVELDGFDLDGGRQTLRGDTLVVRRESFSALSPDYRLPYRGDAVNAATLEPTPLIQADDPRIVRAAERIAGGETDPVVLARRLTEWVYGELEKEITLSVPSATQVLEAGHGDCNEHTVLYVALARALGLPARTAVGVVQVGDRFYY
ncbi:MAG: transglutaminase-like domain-containing protein, partial [Gemmatimonadota bacterium]